MTAFEQPCAAFSSCAAEPCDQDAVTELRHTPPGDAAHWVPLCADHRAAAFRLEAIEYVVECHGFISAVPEVIHLCPHGDNAVTPCCARLVLELPRSHRLTLDPKQVTCGA